MNSICKQIFHVVIFVDKENDSMHIVYCLNPDNCRQMKDSRYALLYHQYFDSMMEALGHKLLLEELSASSLVALIEETNPHHTDLKEK